jgi:AIG2-like family
MTELALLFQYGSNMDCGRLLGKIAEFAPRLGPAGVPVQLNLLGPAELRGWKFVADLYSARGRSRVADIVQDHGGSVWGSLYELPLEFVRRGDATRSVLDRIEGHRTERDPENYEPLQVAVHLMNEVRVAWTYVGCDDARKRCARDHSSASVSDEYRLFVLAGAQAAGLPKGYVSELVDALAR